MHPHMPHIMIVYYPQHQNTYPNNDFHDRILVNVLCDCPSCNSPDATVHRNRSVAADITLKGF